MPGRWIVLWLMMIAVCTALAAPVTPPPQGGADAQATAMKDYEDTVRRADALFAAGDYFEAVRQYERAGRVAYNNKLNIEKAVLDAKLAAGRQARDAKQSTPAAPAAPAKGGTAPASSSTQASPAPADAAKSPIQDYEETVRYGDSLAAAGEYFTAVKAYERARRLAYNNKLPTDTAALEAKIALASKARDVKPSGLSELILPPPPPVPRSPGEKGLHFLPKQPGKFRPWNLHHEGFVVAETKATPAELKALEANLRRIADLVKKAPLLNPPEGFDVYSSATLFSVSPGNEALQADMFFSAPGYFDRHVRSKATGEERTVIETLDDVNCGLRFNVNSVPVTGVTWKDAQGEFFLEPKKQGELGGLPVYDDMLVIARPGDTLWLPITTERLLKFLLPTYKQVAESAQHSSAADRKKNEDYLRPEKQEKRRQEEAAVRAKGGASAEQEARHLEAMHRRWEEDARKVLESGTSDPKSQARAQTYKDAQTMLASLDNNSRNAPACVLTEPVGSLPGWKIVPAGTPGCRMVVRSNPKLLNPKLSRSAMQIMYIRNITDCNKFLETEKQLRENPGDCVAVAKLLRELDWQQFVGLLGR